MRGWGGVRGTRSSLRWRSSFRTYDKNQPLNVNPEGPGIPQEHPLPLREIIHIESLQTRLQEHGRKQPSQPDKPAVEHAPKEHRKLLHQTEPVAANRSPITSPLQESMEILKKDRNLKSRRLWAQVAPGRIQHQPKDDLAPRSLRMSLSIIFSCISRKVPLSAISSLTTYADIFRFLFPR